MDVFRSIDLKRWSLGLDDVTIVGASNGESATMTEWLLGLLHQTQQINLTAVSWVGVIVLIYSAGLGTGTRPIYWIKQCVWLVGGLGIYLFLSIYDYKKLVSSANILFFIGVAALALVLLMPPINGARSWFRLPFMSLQPSELVKIATVLVITKYFSKFHERQSSFWEFVVSAILIAIPVGLIVLQPDLDLLGGVRGEPDPDVEAARDR